MRRSIYYLIVLCFIAACRPASGPAPQLSLVPLPQEIEQQKGFFQVNEKTRFIIPEGDAELLQIASQLAQKIRQRSHYPCPIQSSSTDKDEPNTIILSLDEQIRGPEAYHLKVSPEGVKIKGGTAAGVFYGLQTFRQLFPIPFESSQPFKGTWAIPCLEIKDAPQYSYRGLQLDVARHFFTVDDIKSYLDLMALHKYNTFHWHLTDDQGWRIEIKQYPRLTEIGAWRNGSQVGHASERPIKYDGKRYGGFYTQQEILEIVEYAADRYIQIIPEIEMPGHALAALAAYPRLACTNGPFQVAQGWGVFEEIFCPTEETFTFLQNVLTEVMSLFPGEYIHIGGDEVPKDRWERSRFCQRLIREQGLKDEAGLQSYFIQRIEAFVSEKGRKIIGWDEILEGGLAPNATVMSWRGMQGGIEAARQGHDVIMSPNTYCYFDYYQGDPEQEPLAIGGNLRVKKVYSFSPRPDSLEAEAAQHIIGGQANVWTEYINERDHLFYMVWPRAAALAEVLWTEKPKQDWPGFVSRMEGQLSRLKAMGIPYGSNLFEAEISTRTDVQQITISLNSLARNASIHYRLNGNSPSEESPLYKNPIILRKDSRLRAAVFKDGRQLGNVLKRDYQLHSGVGATLEQDATYSERYTGGGPTALVDGLQGSTNHTDGFWQGYEGQKMSLTLDLGELQSLRSVNMHFLYHPDNWILLPRRVEVLTSEDGQTFAPIRDVSYPYGRREAVAPRREALLTQPKKLKARYIKVEAYPVTRLPSWHPGRGNPAWMFIDEIIIR